MISKEEAITQFKSILGGMASWAILAKSQFMEHLAIFSSWALRDALWKIERAQQEFFLSTALNDSSVRSHAEDREYLPRKATPSRGTARYTNNGTSPLPVPANNPLTANNLDYLNETAVVVPASSYLDVEVSQLSYATKTVTVGQEAKFYEVLFSAEESLKLAKFAVKVNGSEWAYARLFQNALSTDQVYDEFYTHAGQTGIRFGNGIFGAIPTLNSIITVEYWLTEGATQLISSQTLQPVQTLTDTAGNDADFAIITTEMVTGGGSQETIDEMRPNLHYWPRYNEKLIWEDDYPFFIRRKIAGITWMKCWGEQEQEAETGFDVQNINKIFLTGYMKDNATLSADVLEALAGITLLNRKFQWVAPAHVLFTVTITGAVSRNVDIATAVGVIRDLLIADYGQDSEGRVDGVRISDIYRLVKSSGYFDGPNAYYTITLGGTTTPAALNEFVHIDPVTANNPITLTYA